MATSRSIKPKSKALHFHTINPFLGDEIGTYKFNTLKQALEATKVANEARWKWRELTNSNKSKLFLKLAAELRNHSRQASNLMALEMGKPITQGLAEIEKCAFTCEYFANNFERILQAQITLGKDSKTMVVSRPLGVILGIMPWNFPFWQVIRFAIPALAAGNTVIVKHATNTAGCALMLADMFERAGIPNDVYQNLILSHEVTEQVIVDGEISGVSLTGSTQAGIRIAEVAAKKLRKCVFELGGSDAYVVLKDANLIKTVKICAQSRLVNAGQSCISAKRFIVDKNILKAFVHSLVEEFTQQVIGDPLKETTTLGPLARKDLVDQLHKQVQRSIKMGAKIVYQGPIPKKGNFFPITILSKVVPGMPAFDEELFGPVAAVVECRDVSHGIELANQSQYGLGGAIFTKDLGMAEKLAVREFEAGSVFVNDLVRSNAPFPFGGTKLSGYGRELGEFGIHEFCNIKTVQVASL